MAELIAEARFLRPLGSLQAGFCAFLAVLTVFRLMVWDCFPVNRPIVQAPVACIGV